MRSARGGGGGGAAGPTACTNKGFVAITGQKYLQDTRVGGNPEKTMFKTTIHAINSGALLPQAGNSGTHQQLVRLLLAGAAGAAPYLN